MLRIFLIWIALLPAFGASARTTMTRTSYHGWPEAWVLSNGQVEVVVVPAIGRIMQFAFVGEEGVLWENRALDGQVVNADREAWARGEWVNLGGDKAWPAPEGDWPAVTGRPSWRPPPAFDGLPASVRLEEEAIVLITPVDPFLGLRVLRRMELHRRKPVLTVTTTFECMNGAPARVSVWVVAQLKEPAGVFAAVPRRSIFREGYTLLGDSAPAGLRVQKGLLSLTRDPHKSHKIGLDADSLLWVGAKQMLRIDSPRAKRAAYPDKGSSTEIYTNPDPLPYIELETLGPLATLKPGERIERRNVYTLLRRTRATPEAEARALLGR